MCKITEKLQKSKTDLHLLEGKKKVLPHFCDFVFKEKSPSCWWFGSCKGDVSSSIVKDLLSFRQSYGISSSFGDSAKLKTNWI